MKNINSRGNNMQYGVKNLWAISACENIFDFKTFETKALGKE